MRKYSYTAFLIILLLATNSETKIAKAQSPAGQINNATTNVLALTVDQYSDPITKELFDEWVYYSNSFSLSSNVKGEFENSSFCPVSKIFCELTLTNIQRRRLLLSSQSNINEQVIKSHLEDLARKVNRDPQDAKFKVENGKVVTFEESKNGITLDIDKSLKLLLQNLNNNDYLNSPQNIVLPYDSKKSTTNYADVNDLGVSSLIGEGTSNFKGSPSNRIFNIKVATQRFNGLLIKPGEEFSFVKNLGEVDGEHGYLPELVIKNNVTEPEFGGGICQVSTTAFRAAIYSGLKITARRNHAYPVSYYNPQGMDAAVYVPNPDLRFVNNTPNHILIQTKIVGTQLTFSFYGTDDGRKTTVDGPYIIEKQPDGSLKARFTQHVFDSNGTELITDVFNSSYGSPYRYPHPGGPTLSAKPANWSEDEWKAYKKMLKDMAKAPTKAKN
ncbi:MAG: VanW family protein [Parcubacteria group bacterium GW2011_GWD2_38_11]|nr:MAG: VanW family protein [Parcubacteria group bacterium GW2011_GWD2_38_11]